MPVLLLVCALVIPRLNNEAFYFDEGASLFNVGAMRSGPWSITSTLDRTAEHSSEQALGWPFLLLVWGHFVGWNEVAVRTLPLLAGMLTIALVYRAGSELFSGFTGLVASMLLAGSSVFLIYLAVARTFTMVALFTTLTVWCYWRVALGPRPPDRRSQTGLFIGAAGLLYSHYFGALLLPALGISHLLFVRKSQRWWRPVLPLTLALLLATLQLPVLILGVQRTLGNVVLHGGATGPTGPACPGPPLSWKRFRPARPCHQRCPAPVHPRDVDSEDLLATSQHA